MIVSQHVERAFTQAGFFVLVTILCSFAISSSHDTGATKEGEIKKGGPVHQYLTYEAGKVWSDLPDEMQGYLRRSSITATVHRLCDSRYEPGYDIASASADEDQEWWISCNGPGGPYFAPRYQNGFFEHFWDPDEPNFGGAAAYDKGLSDVTEPLGIFKGKQFASAYRKAQELWDRKIICHYTGRDNEGKTCPLDKDQAYYWLGRVVHLLEDMAVPAHVHNVQHDPYADLPLIGLGGKDPFEDYVGSIFSTFDGRNYQGKEYKHEDLPGIALQQDFRWTDIHPNPTNLFKLFWYTAQKTQYYASGGTFLARVGDAGGYRKVNGKAAQFRPSLWNIEGIEPAGVPDDVSKKLQEMAGALVPHALRAVGGLYRLFWLETHPEVLPSNKVVMGVLLMAPDEKLYLAPLVVSDGGKYQSVYVGAYNDDHQKATSVRQKLEPVKSFWLYHKGSLLGNFEVTGFKDASEEGGPQIAFAGDIQWQSALATDSEIILNIVALSQPIPQPFWPQGLHLNSEQTSSLDRILNETLLRAPALLAKALKQRSIDYKGAQRPIGASPTTRSINIMDIDQDGQPEVYATVRWPGKPCDEMYASLLAIWRGSWRILRRSTYLTECPWFETVGDDHFAILAVDVNGDGNGELILSEGRWESWQRALYQLREGKLTKVIAIGGYGS